MKMRSSKKLSLLYVIELGRLRDLEGALESSGLTVSFEDVPTHVEGDSKVTNRLWRIADDGAEVLLGERISSAQPLDAEFMPMTKHRKAGKRLLEFVVGQIIALGGVAVTFKGER